MHRTIAFSFLLLVTASCICAQSVQYIEARQLWLLNTGRSSYAFGLSRTGQLEHLYWGPPLWRADDLPAAPARQDISSFDPHQMLENEEFPGWGGPRYYEPALKISRENGDRDLVLHYASHAIRSNELDVELKD